MRATLDPVATAKIEEFMLAPEERHTIVIVKNMQQAAYVSDLGLHRVLEGHDRSVRREAAGPRRPVTEAEREVRHRPLVVIAARKDDES